MTDSGPGGGPGDGPAPQPRSAASGCGAVVMIVAGAILLLPGLCSLAFMGVAVTASPGDILKDPAILFLWLVCFAVAAGGIWLIVTAVRR